MPREKKLRRDARCWMDADKCPDYETERSLGRERPGELQSQQVGSGATGDESTISQRLGRPSLDGIDDPVRRHLRLESKAARPKRRQFSRQDTGDLVSFDSNLSAARLEKRRRGTARSDFDRCSGMKELKLKPVQPAGGRGGGNRRSAAQAAALATASKRARSMWCGLPAVRLPEHRSLAGTSFRCRASRPQQ